MLTFQDAARVLRYEPKTGLLYWKTGRQKGKVAGCNHTQPGGICYVVITYRKKQYKAHRLAWLLHYGQWPNSVIDHIDHDGQNNRIENLRDVSNSTNTRNQRLAKNNTSGYTGVSYVKRSNTWRAEITVNKKRVQLVNCKDKETAIRKRKEVEAAMFFNVVGDMSTQIRDLSNTIPTTHLEKKTMRNNKSGITGVTWHSRDKKWIASVMRNGKRFYLGYFDTKEEAAREKSRWSQRMLNITYAKH